MSSESNNEQDSRDIGIQQRTKGRYLELAALFKEKKHGKLMDYNRIVSRFAAQEGLTLSKAKKYAIVLEGAGLLKWRVRFGNKTATWVYKADGEWDLFKVTI